MKIELEKSRKGYFMEAYQNKLLLVEVKDNVVVIDLNHPLAGKDLHFKGQVVTMRDATDDELKELIKMMSGEGGCNCEGGCEGGCHHGEGEGCCGGHHHGEGEGCCGGHHHGEGEGCCHKH